MKVSVKNGAACRKVMSIEVPAEKIAEEKKELLKLYTKGASIPGFRKGKAPKHVVESKYQNEILQDVQERIVPKYYHEALDESELKVVGVIDVSEVKIEDGNPLKFDVTVDVEPEFKLPKYEGITVKEEKEEVTDEKVQEQINEMLKQYSEYKDVEGRAIAAGDMAQISYTATADKKPLEEVAPEAKGIGEGKDYWISADENSFLPGMGDAIVGMKAGDTKDVKVTFPKDFMVKEIAGVKAKYSIEITGVRERVLPEINEAFLSRLGVESEEQFRSQMRERMEIGAEQQALNKKHEQIIKFLISKTKMDVPESDVQQQTRSVLYDLSRQRMMMGQTEEQIGEQREELMKEAAVRAEENVKLRYIALAIADEQNFDATEAEIDEEVAAIAIRERKDARTLRKEMEENDTISSVGDQIRFNKALNYMVENAKIK